MADKKKTKKVLVKVSNLNDEELDKALNDALDALLGPDDQGEQMSASKPAVNKTPTKKIKSVKSPKNK
jgi:hypothetical protein